MSERRKKEDISESEPSPHTSEREAKDGGIERNEIPEMVKKMNGLKAGEKGERQKKGVHREVDMFLMLGEEEKSGETQKVVIEDEWLEGETEPKVFEVPQKGRATGGKDDNSKDGATENIK